MTTGMVVSKGKSSGYNGKQLTRVASFAMTIPVAVTVSVASGVSITVSVTVKISILFFVKVVLGLHVNIHGEEDA